MISQLDFWPVAFWTFGIWFLGRWVVAATRYSRKTKSHGCGTLKSYPHREPLLGLDFVLSMSAAFKEHRWLSWMEDTWASVGAKTWQARFMGSRMIYSSEMENMKAMSTSQWQEFVLEPIRVDNGVATPFTGKGVSTADGAFWHRSRDFIKPYFERQAFANLDRLQLTTDRMLDLIPTDGTTFDMQVLIRRWVRLLRLSHNPERSLLLTSGTVLGHLHGILVRRKSGLSHVSGARGRHVGHGGDHAGHPRPTHHEQVSVASPRSEVVRGRPSGSPIHG
jgi:hypothetical protein